MRSLLLLPALICVTLLSCDTDNVAITPIHNEEDSDIARITVFVTYQSGEKGDIQGCGAECNSDNNGVIGANVFLYVISPDGNSDESFTHHQTTNYYGTAFFADLPIVDYKVVVESPLGQREQLVEFEKGGHKQLQFIY